MGGQCVVLYVSVNILFEIKFHLGRGSNSRRISLIDGRQYVLVPILGSHAPI